MAALVRLPARPALNFHPAPPLPYQGQTLMKNFLQSLRSTGFFLLSSAPTRRPQPETGSAGPAPGVLRPLRVVRSPRRRPRIELATGFWSA